MFETFKNVKQHKQIFDPDNISNLLGRKNKKQEKNYFKNDEVLNNKNINLVTNNSLNKKSNFTSPQEDDLLSITISNNSDKNISENNNYELENSNINLNKKTGRWDSEEHQRFIEAILKYGNNWENVEKYVGSRSSSQARSHAQKFFVKVKRTNLLDVNIDLNKNSIKTLQEVVNQMNSDQYLNTIKKLNNVAFEKKCSSRVFPNENKKSNIIYNDKPLLPSFNNICSTNNFSMEKYEILNKPIIKNNSCNKNNKQGLPNNIKILSDKVEVKIKQPNNCNFNNTSQNHYKRSRNNSNDTVFIDFNINNNLLKYDEYSNSIFGYLDVFNSNILNENTGKIFSLDDNF